MNLNEHVEKIVESIIAEISANVLVKVDSVISNAINHRLATYDFSSYIQQSASAAFEKKVSEYTVDQKKLENRIVEKINNTIASVESNTSALIYSSVKKHTDSINFQQTMTDAVSTVVADRLKDYVFPEKSIKAAAIDFSNCVLSGDHISGGLIKDFSSTGIDDKSSQVALTILDDITVVENNLLTKDLTVAGTMTVNGDFVINGKVPEDSNFFKTLVTNTTQTTLQTINTDLFDNYNRVILQKIKDDGLDLLKITFNGQDLVTENRLGAQVTESNLQKLGLVRELQVSGETLLSESVYTTKGRIGINTIEPSTTFDLWDNEVEVTIAKHQKDTGAIGTPRNQKLILFANNQENLTLDPDGSVAVKELRIGSLRFSASDQAPTFVSTRNHIVWNSNPNIGGPIGWVCLGGANWANFGIID